MSQILPNFIDESTMHDVMGPLLTKTFPDNKMYIDNWLLFNIISYHQNFIDMVVNKLHTDHNLELTVNLFSRGVGHPTKIFNIFEQAPEDTSHILFISTGQFTYQALPTSIGEIINFPITLSPGDAYLIKCDSVIDNKMAIYADNMSHFCVLYLEPTDLWP